MTGTNEKYRQSDVNFWGIFAVGCVGLAFALANVSAIMPSSWLSGLHATRVGGGSFAELQNRVAALQDETNRLRTESGRINTILSMGDQTALAVTKRVGALESTIPVLLEQIPLGPNIDSATLTASIGNGTTETEDVKGGSVSVSMKPLFSDARAQTAPAKLPEVDQVSAVAVPSVVPDGLVLTKSNSFGLAMGKNVTLSESYLYWIEIHNKVGGLLLGLDPILVRDTNNTYHLVAGPVDTVYDAESLCAHVLRSGVACLPAPYSGYQLPK